MRFRAAKPHGHGCMAYADGCGLSVAWGGGPARRDLAVLVLQFLEATRTKDNGNMVPALAGPGGSVRVLGPQNGQLGTVGSKL